MLTIMPVTRTKLNYNCINFSNSFTLFLEIIRKLFSLKRKQSRIFQSKHIVPSLTKNEHSLVDLDNYLFRKYRFIQ